MPSKSALNVLYLANYAPILRGGQAIKIQAEGSQPDYHLELFLLLSEFGFTVHAQRDIHTLLSGPENIDYVFSLLNRAPYCGSEIFVSAICEYHKIPYLGARPHIRAIADDKYLGKLIADQLGIKTTKTKIYQPYLKDYSPPSFPGPYFAKPRSGATSKFLSEDCIQDNWSDLKPVVLELSTAVGDVIVEEFVDGHDVSLPVIGGPNITILPPHCIWSSNKGQMFTYDQKRRIDKSMNRSIETDPNHITAMKMAARIIEKELRPIDYFRIDFRIPNNAPPVFLEMNICCNIASYAGFAYSATHAGITQKEMVKKILRYSFNRQGIAWDSL